MVLVFSQVGKNVSGKPPMPIELVTQEWLEGLRVEGHST